LQHPVIGRHAYHTPAYKLSETPFEAKRPGPLLGEHNEYVFKELLGMTDEEIGDLLIDRIITTDADLDYGGETVA